jgi:hypothetical protein
MKQSLFTVIGSLFLFAGIQTSRATLLPPTTHSIIKPAVMSTCNFAFLRGHRKGAGTSLQWGMDGAGAAKFIISRTYEFDPYDPYAVWEDAGSITADDSRMYTFDDNAVYPGTITYKITAIMTDGSKLCSDFKQIQINKKK